MCGCVRVCEGVLGGVDACFKAVSIWGTDQMSNHTYPVLSLRRSTHTYSTHGYGHMRYT